MCIRDRGVFGVDFSCVYGKTTQTLAQVMAHQSPMFFATGLSIVIHPKHPYVPIIHMNVRYFEMTKNIFWFGGGMDLTPHYVNPEEAQQFHQSLKQLCDAYDKGAYAAWKRTLTNIFMPHTEKNIGA